MVWKNAWLRAVVMSWPNRDTLPPWPFRMPVRIFCVVDFPEPLGPRKPKISPSSTVKSRP